MSDWQKALHQSVDSLDKLKAYVADHSENGREILLQDVEDAVEVHVGVDVQSLDRRHPRAVLDELSEPPRQPPVAVRIAKEAILKSLDTPLETGLDHERRLFYLLFSTEDKEEGIRAFLDKRKADFKGR